MAPSFLESLSQPCRNRLSKWVAIVWAVFTLTAVWIMWHKHVQVQTAWKVEEELLSALAATNTGLVSVDPESKVTAWNKGAERLFGYTASEMLGQPMTMLLPSEIAAGHEAKVRTAFTATPSYHIIATACYGVRKDGRHVPLTVRVYLDERNHNAVAVINSAAQIIHPPSPHAPDLDGH